MMKINKRKILVVDDNDIFCESVRDILRDENTDVLTANTGKDGLKICQDTKVDVVILDQKLPDTEGVSLCPSILKENDQTKIIFVTAYPSFSNAVEAIKVGAHDYLSKPFEMAELELTVKQAFRTQELEKTEQIQNYHDHRESEEIGLISGQGVFDEILKMIDLAAASDAPVLITGETGTGKNVVARAIHYKSNLPKKLFLTTNCAAFPESLIEAELFGYMKGAFTGATSNSKGLFEAAQGGTIFLDEIGELPLHMQVKLLRVLQEKRIRPLGSTKEITVDARVIAATNRDLLKMIDEGTFRQDLYYRLAVIPMRIPSLTERREDIATLAINFVERFSSETGKTISLCKEGIAILESRDWPGNVRELENLMERAVALTASGEVIDTELFREAGPRTRSSSTSEIGEGFNLPEHLNGIEKSLVTDALERSGGNQTKAAALLGIPVHSIRHLIGKHNL
jgi:DNA-binding NtrC family response regulator